VKAFTCERNTLYGISILAYIISARECDIGAKNCPPIQVAAQLAALEAMMNVHHSHHVPLRYGKTEAQKIFSQGFQPLFERNIEPYNYSWYWTMYSSTCTTLNIVNVNLTW